MRVFKGSYSKYHQQLEIERLQSETELTKSSEAENKTHKRLQKKGESRRKLRLLEIEEQITRLEEQLATLALRLENPPTDSAQVQELGEDYVEIQDEINALIAEWEQLHKENGNT